MSRLHTVLPIILLLFLSPTAHSEEVTMNVPRFGTVHLYRPGAAPEHVALFISGEGGWNHAMGEMADALAGQDTLVVGIDIIHYLQTLARSERRCDYAAADFEALSQEVQQRLSLHRYENPVLVGYSSGAALAYAVAVEAPPGTFRGALSLGFAPELPLKRPLCAGSGLRFEATVKGNGVHLLPASALQTPWVVLTGENELPAERQRLESFTARIPAARVIVLPKVGHELSATADWLVPFKNAFLDLATATTEQAPPSDSPLRGLPLVEVPASAGSPASDCLALLVTGDGGWAGLDKGVAGELANAGIPVIGLNSLKYFWTPRDAATTTRDVERIARRYLAAWNKPRLLLIGYSFGADVLPFAADGLPADLKQRVALMALIGPDLTATFEFHVYDWMGSSFDDHGVPIRPVLERLRGVPPTLCIYGSEETRSLCRDLEPALAKKIELKGAHHFEGDYAGLARRILAELKE